MSLQNAVRLGALCVFCMLLPMLAWGQASTSGTVTGTISDPSGADVSGATVTLKNVGTNTSQTMQSASSGVYTFTDVPPATYELTVTAPGFESEKVGSIKVDVAANRRVDVALRVGAVNVNVNVEAAPPVLNTENASTGQVIETQEVLELPLNGRDFEQLQLLTPGTVSTNNYQTNQGMAYGATTLSTSQTNSMNISNGSRPSGVLFTIDGASDSNQNARTLIYEPSIDEIAEFREQTADMSAEYGYGSSVVNVSIKSGTNQLHGDAYDFLRNSDMDARSFFAQTVEPLKRNQFGGTLGGPVVFPKLYNGKDKTFFFFAYEGEQLRQASTSIATVPTAAERAGDFSQTGVQIYDPLSTVPDPAHPGSYLRTPFPGDVIPASRINPVAKFFLGSTWIPLPNLPGNSNNFLEEVSVPTNYNQGTAKIDQYIGTADRLMGRFSLQHAYDGNYGPYHGFSQYDPGANPDSPNSYNSVLDWIHTFSPTNLLDARFAYSRAHANLTTPNIESTDYDTQLGIQGFAGISNIYPSFPSMGISGYTGLPAATLYNYISNDYEPTVSYTMVRGRHTFKMGSTYRAWQQNITDGGQGSGSFGFSGQYTNNPESPNNTGSGLADFILGVPNSGGRYVPPGWYYQRIKDEWAYVNDDWKATNKLTVTLGVRYEINWPTTEKNGQFATFDPSARGGQGAIVVPSQASVSPPYVQSSVPLSWPVYGPLSVFANQVGINPTYLRKVVYDHFAPRVGLAYLLDSKTVIRAGYGYYYIPLDGNRESETESAPFLIRESGIQNTPFLPTKTIQTLFPQGSTFSPQATLYGEDPNARNFGYSQQWNFSIQRQLARDLSWDIAYVGTTGTDLQTTRLINTPLPGPGDVQARRPYPDFGLIYWDEQSANSIYHALQTKLERRFSKGFSLLAAFTWSKSIDDDSDDSEGFCGCSDPYDTRALRGLSSFDIPFAFTLSAVYDLPWFNSGNAFTRTVVGGWTVATIITEHSGVPYTIYYSGDPSNTGTGSFADVVYGCNTSVPNPTPQQWFNTACFTAPPGPPTYRWGDVGRDTMRGDSYHNFDISLYKNFRFTEARRLELRFEGFNVFNEHSFSNPGTTVNSPGFGQISGVSPGRILQVAGKLYF